MKTRTIIEQDKQAIEAEVQPYERKAWLLNLLMQRMDEIGYPVITADIDAQLITGTNAKIIHGKVSSVLALGCENYIRTLILESSQLELAGGLKLNRQALFDVIEVPNLTEVQSVERQLKEYHRTPIESLGFSDGKFFVTDETKAQAIEKHTAYARNDKHAQLFNDSKALVACINKFYSKHGPATSAERSRHSLGSIDAVLVYNSTSNQFEVDTRAILHKLVHLIE